MRWLRRRFRPVYDDPGSWGAPVAPDEQAFAAVRQSAANEAQARLRATFGALAQIYGAAGQVTMHADAVPSTDQLTSLTRAVLTADYYRARLRPPFCGPGGLADPDNRRRWEQLRPWLETRLAAVLGSNLPGSLVERALLARMPAAWLPRESLQRAVAAQGAAAGWTAPVRVELTLRAAPEHDPWARVAATRAAVQRALADGGLALLEPVHDPTRPALTEPLLVVRALASDADGGVMLLGHEPDAPSTEIRLEVKCRDGAISFARRPQPEDRPSLRGLRCWTLEAADPPRFGAARVLRYLFPWRLLWWLRHLP